MCCCVFMAFLGLLLVCVCVCVLIQFGGLPSRRPDARHPCVCVCEAAGRGSLFGLCDGCGRQETCKQVFANDEILTSTVLIGFWWTVRGLTPMSGQPPGGCRHTKHRGSTSFYVEHATRRPSTSQTRHVCGELPRHPGPFIPSWRNSSAVHIDDADHRMFLPTHDWCLMGGVRPANLPAHRRAW